jgi:hypothetical protein
MTIVGYYFGRRQAGNGAAASGLNAERADK